MIALALKTPDIKTRMLIVALLPALLISLAFSLFVLNQRHNIAEAALLDRGALLTRQLAPAAEYGVFSGNHQELQRLAEAVARETDPESVVFSPKINDNLLIF